MGRRYPENVSPPLCSVRANYPDGSGTAEVQITNPAGGILGGDCLEMDVTVAPGASATVIIQAANKAYRGAGSSQRAVFRLGNGAFLEYLPRHLIPTQALTIARRPSSISPLTPPSSPGTLSPPGALPAARGSSSPASAAGRRYIENSIPEAIDGLKLPGGGERFGEYSYAAAAYVLAPNLEPLADDLHRHFAGGMPGVLTSASAPAQGLCVVRVLACDTPALYRALNLVRDAARGILGLLAPARTVS